METIRMITKEYRHLPFWLFSFSIIFGLTLPVLIQEGMFQDAVLYSSVSHNLSIGFGTFWHPQYSTLNLEGIPSFHEQPPLVFGIQALFYTLLGDSMYVERFYTLLMIILHVLLIHVLWKEIFKTNPHYRNIGWLPVMFWILIPVCFWSFRNNMIENTVSIFTLLSIITSYKIIQRQNLNIFWWIVSGIFIFLASFSKGVPGLFPLTFPLIYWFVFRTISFRKSVLFAVILTLVPVLIYAVLLLIPESRHSLSIYFFDRLVRRVNTMPTADYRLQIMWRLFTELIPVLVVVALAVIFTPRSRKRAYAAQNMKEFYVFLLIGLSGTIPLTLTMVQKGWYMVPAFPFFAISFAIIVVPVFTRFVHKIQIHETKFTIALVFSLVLLSGVLAFTFMQKDKISREKDIITDVYKIGAEVPPFSTLTVPPEMYDQYDFVLQGFLVRYFNISISPYNQFEYFLKLKNSDYRVPDEYRQLELKLSKYELYKKTARQTSCFMLPSAVLPHKRTAGTATASISY